MAFVAMETTEWLMILTRADWTVNYFNNELKKIRIETNVFLTKYNGLTQNSNLIYGLVSLIQEVQECVTAATQVQPADVKGLIKSTCRTFNAADSEICVCDYQERKREGKGWRRPPHDHTSTTHT